MWERGERKQVLNGRKGKIVQNVLYGERKIIEHMWNGCSDMRERERKEQGEIQKKKRMGDRNKNVIF
jgi:hypothetical protein